LAKYDYEFKKKVVEAYFQGHGSYRQIALLFGISSGHGVVRRWLKQVTALGFDSLRKQKRRSDYTIQFKLDVINYYLNSGESIRDVAHKFNLPNDSMVLKDVHPCQTNRRKRRKKSNYRVNKN